MSVEVWSIALNAKIGNPAKKAVLLGLANHASPDGKHCYPSVKRLAVYSELSESTVRTKLAELREDKIIKVIRKSYRYRPTEYEINIKKLKAMRSSDLHLLEVSSETPTVRGTSPVGLEAQTSEKPIPDLQETDIRPTGDGGKPSLTIKEPSLKDSRSNDRGRKDSIRKALEEEFVDISRLKSPKLNTEKQKKAAAVEWWNPLREIAELTDWDERRGRSLIRFTVIRMRKDNLTISSPKSILNVAKSIVAEGTGRSISGAKEIFDDLRRNAT